MSVLWTAADAAAATGGQAQGDWQATGVSIDSRTLDPGDLFVALRDARDGHAFVAQALARGAAAALVSRRPAGVAADAPLLIVDDVLAALGALGAAVRARTCAKVVAVTGSVGKTSTKEMLRVMLAGQGRTHAAEASYNNHWGVPLTLARMPVDTEFAVIEIGMNHAGETAPLARLTRPHVALITTVVAAHLEAFASVADIAREKATILDGLEPGGVAVLNGDLDVTPILIARARRAGAKIISFGRANCDFRLRGINLHGGVTQVRATAHGAEFRFAIRAVGRHFALNALGALAVADALGLDPLRAAADLENWTPPIGRGARETLALDVAAPEKTAELIDDAFNANPASLAAALEVLAAIRPDAGGGRRIAILGDMLELGADEIALHRAVADDPSLGAVTLVHCVGPRMRALYDMLPARQRGEWHETADAMAARADAIVDAGDIVLVKGSKGSRVSVVVDALRKLGQAVPTKGLRD